MSPEAGISGSPQNPEAARMTEVPFPSRAFPVRKAEAPRDCLLPPNSRQGLPASVYTSRPRGQNTHPADECPRASRWRAQVRSGGRGHAHRARARWPRAGRPAGVPARPGSRHTQAREGARLPAPTGPASPTPSSSGPRARRLTSAVLVAQMQSSKPGSLNHHVERSCLPTRITSIGA